jgi:hypothetical protein
MAFAGAGASLEFVCGDCPVRAVACAPLLLWGGLAEQDGTSQQSTDDGSMHREILVP